MPSRTLPILLTLLAAMPAAAQQVHRLSPEAARAAIEAGAARNADDGAIAGDAVETSDRLARQPHGSVSAFVGSGGRGVALDLLAPLGRDGALGIAILNRSGRGYGSPSYDPDDARDWPDGRPR